MIRADKLRERARMHGVPESTVERDYAQNWLLWALSDIEMAFKGGTCIRKLYIPDYRFSDDLDFTMIRYVDKEEISGLISERVSLAGEKSGISFSEDIRVEENFNGFEISVYFRILWVGGSPLKIKLDITRHDREIVLMPFVRKRVVRNYEDVPDTEIMAYSLEEIFSEKIRSIFERTRPRDMYDIWSLKDSVDVEKVMGVLPEKLKYRDVNPDMERFLSRKDYFGMAWKNSLSHQIKDLPDFEDVFREILPFIGELV